MKQAVSVCASSAGACDMYTCDMYTSHLAYIYIHTYIHVICTRAYLACSGCTPQRRNDLYICRRVCLCDCVWYVVVGVCAVSCVCRMVCVSYLVRACVVSSCLSICREFHVGKALLEHVKCTFGARRTPQITGAFVGKVFVCVCRVFVCLCVRASGVDV